ncbi:g4730 [Coccomyxa elongata]
MLAQVGAHGPSQEPDSVKEDADDRCYLQALLLCFFASQNRSLVATRFLVETLLEMHLEGFTLADMEVMLSLARLESGGKLVEPLEQEILLSWCAMVMLTLETVGLPRRPYAEERRKRLQGEREQKGRMELGMQGFVAQIIDMYRRGFDAKRMLLQQSLAQEEDGVVSQGTNIMQQNTRLIILTLEVLRESHMETSMLLSPSVLTPAAGEESVSSMDSDDEARSEGASSTDEPSVDRGGVSEQVAASKVDSGTRETTGESLEEAASQIPQEPTPPVEYIFDFLPERRKAEVLATESREGKDLQTRSAALHLLMAFVGAHLQLLYSVQAFVEKAYVCYRLGYTVQELYEAIAPEEVVHGTSGALPVAADSAAESHRANKLLFGQWLSIVYMTYAQMGAKREGGAVDAEGWAWVETPETSDRGVIEAYRLADFVKNTLRIQAEAEEKESGGLEVTRTAAEAAFREHFKKSDEVSRMVQKQVEEGTSVVKVEDPSLRASSPTLTMLSHFTGLVKLSLDLLRRQQQQKVAELSASTGQ